MLTHTNYDGTDESIPDLTEITFRKGLDTGNLDSLPFMFKLVLVTVMIITGKTAVEMRSAVRQAYNQLKGT